jgi:16S rRNA (uracil1498-N3)-methyltransferase
MRSGDEITVCQGDGYEYRVRLTEVSQDMVLGAVVGKEPGKAEPAVAVDVYLSLLNKPDKYEWALQKCTELGASVFVPLVAERSVVGPPEKGRRERWERIVREAAEQSGRTALPKLAGELSFAEAVRVEGERLHSDVAHLALVPTPGADLSLRDALRGADHAQTVSLFIGPEGGFSDDELQSADESGLLLVAMGRRILRAETAAVAGLAMVMYELDDA